MNLSEEGTLRNTMYNNLLEEAINVGEIGLGVWNITKETMDLSEKNHVTES